MEEVDLEDLYYLERKIGPMLYDSGRFGHVHVAVDKKTGTEVTLKLFERNSKLLKQGDIVREFKTSRFLMAHPNVVTTVDALYSCQAEIFFIQELAPCGSLKEVLEISKHALSELHAKKLLKQVSSALKFIHDEALVHGMVDAKNVLVFDPALNVVKLTNFGLTRRERTSLKYLEKATPYLAPELCEKTQKDNYSADQSTDVWALGILMFFATRGRCPWDEAKFSNPAYFTWKQYVNGRSNVVPHQFTWYSDKMQKFFRRTLNPKTEERYMVKDIKKYFKAPWFVDNKPAELPGYVYGVSLPSEHRSLSHKRRSLSESRIVAWMAKPVTVRD